MTDAEALAIFKAGQRFLEALHPHLDDRGLETFDMLWRPRFRTRA